MFKNPDATSHFNLSNGRKRQIQELTAGFDRPIEADDGRQGSGATLGKQR
jgi:hypothetical protein